MEEEDEGSRFNPVFVENSRRTLQFDTSPGIGSSSFQLRDGNSESMENTRRMSEGCTPKAVFGPPSRSLLVRRWVSMVAMVAI
jgi:hypothetical protein